MADRIVLLMGVAAALCVNFRISRASSTFFPRTRSATCRTFLGG